MLHVAMYLNEHQEVVNKNFESDLGYQALLKKVKAWGNQHGYIFLMFN